MPVTFIEETKTPTGVTFMPEEPFQNPEQTEEIAGKVFDTATITEMPLNEAHNLHNYVNWNWYKPDLSTDPIVQKAGKVAERLGKKFYNDLIPNMLKESVFDIGGGRVSSYIAAYLLNKKLESKGVKPPSIWQTQKMIKAGTMAELDKLIPIPTAEVGPQMGTEDKIIDAVAGIIAFVTHIAVLKKIVPSMPEPFVWETVNLSNGGMPGGGAAMQLALGGIGKVIPGKGILPILGRVSATSTLFGTTTYLGGGDTTDILINMGIPIVFEAMGITKQGWEKYKNKDALIGPLRQKAPALADKAVPEIEQAISDILLEKPPTIVAKPSTKAVETPKAVEGVARTAPPPVIAPQAKPEAAVKGLGAKPAEPIVTVPKPDIKTLTDKALSELAKAERPREIIEAEKTKELGKRVAISAQAAETTTGEERLYAALRPLKGELTEYKRPDFKPLKETMPVEDIDALHDDVWTRPWSQEHFDKLNTAKAWAKVVEGFVPTRGEILMLEKQWGKEFAKGLLKKLPLGDKIWDAASDISNFLRTMTAGGDVSVAGRQLRVLGQLYPKEYGKAIAAGAKAYISEDLSKEIRKEYESSLYHNEAKKYIKFFEPAGMTAVEPSERPEWYVSHYPEKLPIIGHLIRMGNRNYVETTNAFTQAIWDKLRINDARNGIEPTKIQLTERGKWLASMEGRPEIGGIVGRRLAPITAGFFFAPRYAISRFTTPLYLRKLTSGDPVAREIGKNTAKAFASFIGTNIAILTLIKLYYGDDAKIELNPRSADWGKGRIGNTRIDLWTGYQQAARFLVQLTTGQYKTAAGKIRERERLDTVGTFVRSKENPLVALIADLWAGKTYQGEKPFSVPKGETGKKLEELGVPDIIQGVGKEAYNRMLFMWVQDFADASINDGYPTGLAAGALSFVGVNTQSYPDTAYTKTIKFQDQLAQKEYGKNWEDLNPTEQKYLSRINKKELADFELQTRIEGMRRDDYDYVAGLIEDEKKAGKNIYNKLKPENQKALDEVGISLGLSRKIDDWMLNDERYEKYQEVMSQILDEKLTVKTSQNNWKDMAAKTKTTKLELAIESAREKARNEIKREAKQE